MGFILSLILFLAIVGATFWSVAIVRNRAWFEFLPTVFWQVIMAGSFVFQYHSFDKRFVNTQALAIGIFSVAIFISDYIQLPRLNWLQTRWSVKILHLAYFLIVLAAVFQLTHLYLMPEIPLIAKWKDKFFIFKTWLKTGKTIYLEHSVHYMELRESSSKLLNVPLLFIYLCHGMLLAFAPLSILITFKKKKWVVFAMALSFFVFYSRASLAKGTIYLFTAIMALQFWFLIAEKWRRHLAICGGVGAGLVSIYCSWVLFTHPSSIFIYKAKPKVVADYYERIKEFDPPVPQILTNADHGRLFENKTAERVFTELEKFVNFFAYRAWFVPVEVSHFWYHYYPNVSGSFLGFYGLSPATRGSPDFVHPANKVGLWAYRTRFPNNYYESVRAYCSIDADAYARFGFPGVVAIALLLMLIRMTWKFFRLEGNLGTALYASFLFVLGSALPAASIFAIVLANGVLLYFALLFLFSVFKLKESF